MFKNNKIYYKILVHKNLILLIKFTIEKFDKITKAKWTKWTK